jgi:hypothetical protein
VPSYIAESYLALARRGELASLASRARAAATALTEQGHEVAYLRCAFVPEDEVCLLWFSAPSPTAVAELGRKAKLEFDRVIEELERPPDERPHKEEPCAPESA